MYIFTMFAVLSLYLGNIIRMCVQIRVPPVFSNLTEYAGPLVSLLGIVIHLIIELRTPYLKLMAYHLINFRPIQRSRDIEFH